METIPETADEKLRLIREKVRELLSNRVTLLANEAMVLSSDMECLVRRLASDGHLAKVEDLRAGRWYRTASDVRLLQNIYSYICALMVEGEGVVTPDDDTEEMTMSLEIVGGWDGVVDE